MGREGLEVVVWEGKAGRWWCEKGRLGGGGMGREGLEVVVWEGKAGRWWYGKGRLGGDKM